MNKKVFFHSLIVGCGATRSPSSVRCIDKYAFMGCLAGESRGQVPVTHMATQRKGLEEAPGMPNVNSL